MTDVAAAYDALRSRAESGNFGMPIVWREEDNAALPDTPAPFVYFEIDAERGRVVELGGGRGNNRYRNGGELVAYVFVPRGWGMRPALARAETVAARFRSYRDAHVTCAEATVLPVAEGEGLAPPGVRSPAENYAAAMAVIRFRFDQIG